ncbi:nicotinamidase-related amidase [Hamadaea flava]|uniref:Cysteine hydrolase family protein n=1 Tax=Hamadaea flava TaxID=1742688 RepID=A0ABV8LGL7_9ACTN|nr:cysteine hydrolase family protein [Hamadaea flava]MCP2324341.1 nicotinamidase-related amidase [Hamadaea flava]
MTTLENRPGTALLVVDVQNGVMSDAYERDRVVATIGRLVDRARDQHVPVVWVQHNDESLVAGGEPWRIVPELSPKDGDPVVQKHHADSFEATGLDELLAGLGVGRVLVTGAATDACVRATLHNALARGYDTTLVGDAHTTGPLPDGLGLPSPDQVIAHTNFYWAQQTVPGRVAATVPADQAISAGRV